MGPDQTDKILHSKGNHLKKKRQPTEWEKIVSKDATNQGLISKTGKQLKKLNSKKTKQNKIKQTKKPNWKMGRRCE